MPPVECESVCTQFNVTVNKGDISKFNKHNCTEKSVHCSFVQLWWTQIDGTMRHLYMKATSASPLEQNITKIVLF